MRNPNKPVGWRREPVRHGLAAKGISTTSKRADVMSKVPAKIQKKINDFKKYSDNEYFVYEGGICRAAQPNREQAERYMKPGRVMLNLKQMIEKDGEDKVALRVNAENHNEQNVLKMAEKKLNLLKGLETDLYRLYKDEEGVYHHYKGNTRDLKFKIKNWQRPMNMSIGHYPTSNFKVVD